MSSESAYTIHFTSEIVASVEVQASTPEEAVRKSYEEFDHPEPDASNGFYQSGEWEVYAAIQEVEGETIQYQVHNDQIVETEGTSPHA